MIKVVSFDLDGTAIKRDFDYALWGVMSYYGRGGTLWKFIGNHRGVSDKQAYHDGALLSDTIIGGRIAPQAWLQHYGIPEKEREVLDAVPECIIAYDDFLSVARKMNKSVSKVCITESSGLMLQKKLDDAGIRKFFANIYSSFELFRDEKDSKIFQHVLDVEKVAPDEVLHVGDNILKDYVIPRRMGIQAFFIDVNRNERNISDGRVPDTHCLKSLDDLLKVIM